ncbi:hypothetical protein GCM10028791_24880 [Echinicola sediminis]
MDIWDRLYQMLVEEYKLSEKPALMGVSRGGLFIYNWAKRNPDKVSCIYAEAPVCDFKSWPGGFGNGKGSPGDWEKLKEVYGFETDEAAKAYKDLPMNNLQALADKKVPVLHMIGLHDQVVPPEENTYLLIQNYIKAGGPATVIPCTQGQQDLFGHHFPIESPKMVADFIYYHTVDQSKLKSADFHTLRNSLKNSKITFERTKKGRVAFLGGSITYNPGWRDSIMVFLQERFPETEFEFINAGIPSMGTVPGAFRLERDILSKGRIDLLFEEAAVNDASNGRSAEEQLRGMEGIIRQLRKTNPETDIVMFHFVDPDKIKSYHQGNVPEVIQNHEAVAEHYGVSSINLAKEVSLRIANGEFTWEGDFKNLHPSPFGQQVYAQSMVSFLQNAYSRHLDEDDKLEAFSLPDYLTKGAYDKGHLVPIQEANMGKGWSIVENWTPSDGTGTRNNFVDVPMLISEQVGSKLKFRFEGNAVGIAVAAGQDAGTISYRVDKGEWKSQNLYTKWSKHLHLPWYYVLEDDLEKGEHLIEIKVAEEKDPHSAGNACRIRYFIVNK